MEEGDKFDEDFKVDHNALQGILNNTGIKVCKIDKMQFFAGNIVSFFYLLF